MPTGSGEGSPECPLASEFPTVPAATRQRFLTARDGDVALASSMLREHLAWRAANFPLRDGAPRIGAGLPEFVWVHPGRARDGTRILTEMCCMIDKKCASNDEYELAVAQFLFDLFDDESDEKVTVLIDCRPTVGQPNILIPRSSHPHPNPHPHLHPHPHPHSYPDPNPHPHPHPEPNVLIPRLLSMIQQISRTLSNHFPERFENVIAYPVPYTLTVFYSMVRPWPSANPTFTRTRTRTRARTPAPTRAPHLSPNPSPTPNQVRPFISAKSAEKVTLLVGPSTTESPCPVKLG